METTEQHEALRASLAFRRKQRDGAYPTVPSRCLCAGTEAAPIAERDRYGHAHRMVLCRRCGLIRADPMMTPAALARFYTDDYEGIYGPLAPPPFVSGLIDGTLQDFLGHFDLHPRVVVDVGCGNGAWLAGFPDAIRLGCDLNPAQVAEARKGGGLILEGDVDALIPVCDHEADLVIVNHVLEHLPDLEGALDGIRRLLKPGGMCFVAVPGLYAWDRAMLWQNAHLWQFTAQTLGYVMRCMGFEEWYSDECVTSLWRMTDTYAPRTAVPPHEAHDIAEWWNEKRRRIREVKTTNKYPVADRRGFLEASCKLGLEDIAALTHTTTAEAIIVGGGPSADTELARLRALRPGRIVLAIDRMLPWCAAHDIAVDYCVAIDADPAILDELPGAPTFLVADQCHPDAIAKLAGRPRYLFHTPQGTIDHGEIWAAAGLERATIVNIGGSVTLGSMSLALLLGARRLHVFGFDCHLGAGDYAHGIAGASPPRMPIEVEIEGRAFTTTAALLSFAQQFFLLRQLARDTGQLEDVRVYGDTLIRAMAPEGETVDGA